MTRRNLLDSPAEAFPVPLLESPGTALGGLVASVRRFLDLQAGSIWRDLRPVLVGVSGDVLDVGCGAQVYRRLLGSSAAYRGIDSAEARARFGYECPDTTYFEGDSWPVDEASVDCVLCTEVLEHVPDPAAFLRRVQKCLRPGGRLLLTVPFAARWHFVPHDYWRFTPSGLGLLLEEAGFSEIAVHARGNPFTVACYKAMALPLMLLSSRGLPRRILGVLLSPFLVLAACAGNVSLGFDWGEDCLGYTVTACRSSRS